MDQDATGYESMGHSPGDFVLDREPTQFPPPQKGVEPPPQFLAHVYYGQAAGWIKIALGMEVGLGPGHTVLDGDPTPLPKNGVTAPPKMGIAPNFWFMSRDQTAGWMKTPLGTEADLSPGHIVLEGAQFPREMGRAAPTYFRPMSIVTTVAHLSY